MSSIKVREFNMAGRLQGAPRSVSSRSDPEAEPLTFQRTLTDMSKREHEEHLASLIADIEEQGKRLARRPIPSELERYRSLVRSFLNDVISNGYEFSRDSAGGRRHGRFFVTVKTVDEKLTELADAVLASQETELELLARVGELQGLLVDLVA
ncbi:MAG: YaaR family protein [Oscillospiraceae bacterium]|jgi:uncharacterized protein YaaR (DUF327 family)|nr:YaaR family protein [Oscillospiraceae bacterium]